MSIMSKKIVPENHYKYSPFRNLGPQQPYEEMNGNQRKNHNCRELYEGKIFKTNQGYEIEVVDFMDAFNVMVRFTHDNYYKLSRITNIKNGEVAYPFHPNKYGGFFGVGPYNGTNPYIDKKMVRKISQLWFAILERCNCDISVYNTKYKSYVNTSICNEWLNFQNFAFWYCCYLDYINPDPKYNYQIDKDILQFGQKYKIYSPKTCCLIPQKLNAALTLNYDRPKAYLPIGINEYITSTGITKYCARQGYTYLGVYDTMEEAFLVFKESKEKSIRYLADRYLIEGAICKYIRDAIYNIDIKPFGE